VSAVRRLSTRDERRHRHPTVHADRRRRHHSCRRRRSAGRHGYPNAYGRRLALPAIALARSRHVGSETRARACPAARLQDDTDGCESAPVLGRDARRQPATAPSEKLQRREAGDEAGSPCRVLDAEGVDDVSGASAAGDHGEGGRDARAAARRDRHGPSRRGGDHKHPQKSRPEHEPHVPRIGRPTTSNICYKETQIF
jgi:hypothetical protein